MKKPIKLSVAAATCLVFVGTFAALVDTALAFQPQGGSAKVTPRAAKNLIRLPFGTRTFEKQTSFLMQSASDDNEAGQNREGLTDADGLRRRQLVFSMLYGSAALTTSSANADEQEQVGEAADTGVDATTTDAFNNFETINILKPPKDDREYVSYVLENGLRVLLCSDPSSNEAAAAMDVHVGACSDPVDVPGMAHFTGKSTVL